jgi:spermidine/putrescine transport system ATP-binding protein
MAETLAVEIKNVSKKFGDFTAVNNVSLEIQRGEFFALLGPSGCGKTTLLRMIAGFEEPNEGNILIQGENVTGVPPHQRPVNMVFQHYALFPHLTIEENIAFGLKYRPIPKEDYPKKVQTALELVQLQGYEKRLPSQLSGGQRQRVALARALILEPKVLLLDEPLSALDQKLRKEMQSELKRLQRQLGISFIFVTHDQEEALTMSDRIAVMNRGHLEQLDTGHSVFEKPQTDFVADFMGIPNRFSATVESADSNSLRAKASHGFEINLRQNNHLKKGDQIRLAVRPEKIVLQREPLKDAITFEVSVFDSLYQGVQTTFTVQHASGSQWVIAQSNANPDHEFKKGDRAFIGWNVQHTILLQTSNDNLQRPER